MNNYEHQLQITLISTFKLIAEHFNNLAIEYPEKAEVYKAKAKWFYNEYKSALEQHNKNLKIENLAIIEEFKTAITLDYFESKKEKTNLYKKGSKYLKELRESNNKNKDNKPKKSRKKGKPTA